VNSTVGDFAFIQDNAIIGHDVKIGKWVRIDCNVVCIAGVDVGDGACIHTGAIINHNVRIGSGASVGAGSFVIRSVKPDTTVYGNPAKALEL
jgi:acetyltransferase-like isoleucine patch superfamily enzyme